MSRWLTAATLAIALAGCSRSEPEQPAPAEPVAEPTDRPDPVPSAIVQPAPLPTSTPAPAAPPPPPPVEPDEQMLDDASATGMTARSEREDESVEQAPANPAPAEDAALRQ